MKFAPKNERSRASLLFGRGKKEKRKKKQKQRKEKEKKKNICVRMMNEWNRDSEREHRLLPEHAHDHICHGGCPTDILEQKKISTDENV